MKLLLLSDLNSVHTKKWVKGLSEKGVEVAVFGLTAPKDDYYSKLSKVQVRHGEQVTGSGSKMSYLKEKGRIKEFYKEFAPDVVHAHYATSYGMLGSLLKHKPYFISVWGSDVYVFPNRSFLNKAILKRNLRRATHVCSTSHDMAKETAKYTSKSISVVPFGVDIQQFKPALKIEGEPFTFGIVKSLETNYGVDLLIQSFADLVKETDKPLHLKIVGTGSQEDELKKIALDLGVKDQVEFCGYVDNSKLAEVYNQMDVVVIPTRHTESFGVAAVEASSCGKPVIVSNIGGLPEVVIDNETGLVFEAESCEALTEKMKVLLNDNVLANQLGNAGRKRVEKEYDWDKNLSTMIQLYQDALG